MRGTVLMSAIVMLMGTSALAQTTQPTTSEAPATPTSPKGALKALTIALNNGDKAAVKTLMLADNPKEQEMVGAMASMAHAVADLHHALVIKFGEAQAKTVLGDDEQALKQSLATIDSADVKEDGDHATVTVGGNSASAMHLTKVGDQWKVTLGEQAKTVSAKQVDAQCKTSMGQVKTLDDTAKEVTAGKYASASDVATALRDKMAAAPEMPAAAPPVTTKPVEPPK